MAPGQWYYTQNGQQSGPVSFYQLQQLANSAALKPSDYVWTDGHEDWRPASDIAGLFSAAASPAAPSPGRSYQPATGGPDLVMPSDPPRDPTVMAILSFLLPGLGQIVLGQNVKGIVLLVLYFGVGFATVCVGSLPVLIIAIIDAYQIAVKLRNGQPVRQWEFF